MTAPLVAVALLLAMLGLALILDRLWLEAARLELTTAAEAAALAAARELASDARLQPHVDPRSLEDLAVQAAMMTAVQNRAAGQPVMVEESDIAFFPRPSDHSNLEYIDASESSEVPNRVVVTAHRTRFRGNPVALFVSELTRQPSGDAIGTASARLDSRVAGVRPFSGATVPAIPLAIWQRDPSGERTDTWYAAIEERRGRDDFGFDPETNEIVQEPDGIPELTLRSQALRGTIDVANLQLIDVGNQFQDDVLERQWSTGWTTVDLATWGGELRLSSGTLGVNSSSLSLRGLSTLQTSDRIALEQLTGQPRLAVLY